MPAETHQMCSPASEVDVLTLLCGLLGDPAGGAGSTLAECGLDEADTHDLWDAVCEEFAERTLGPELDPDALDPTMTLRTLAKEMAARLRLASHGAT